MDILYLISYAGAAGTEKYVEDLMRLFTARGCRCHLAYCVPGPLSEKAAAAGYPSVRLDMRPQKILAAARRLGRYCRREGVEVIHAQYPRENVIAVLSRLFCPGVRVVFTSHLTIRQGPLWRWLNRLVTPRDACVISVCAQGAELLRRNGVCPARIRVICNGVAPKPDRPRQNAVREEFSLPADCFVILTMARYAPEKGLFVLLDALAEVRRRTARPFACLIAGEGEQFEAVRARVRELGLGEQVIQAGFRRDTETLLLSADLYVSSALYHEAMSFAVLEAMECGLPLVVTDVGAGRELAETGETCGIAVPPGDAAALAAGILRLLEDEGLRRAWGEAARHKARTEFDLDRQASLVFGTYGAGKVEKGLPKQA